MLCPTQPREEGKTMGEPRETRQEQEARWDAQRAARDQELRNAQQARKQRRRRTGVILGATVLIVSVIAAIVLL
jgi:hypothetical protein